MPCLAQGNGFISDALPQIIISPECRLRLVFVGWLTIGQENTCVSPAIGRASHRVTVLGDVLVTSRTKMIPAVTVENCPFFHLMPRRRACGISAACFSEMFESKPGSLLSVESSQLHAALKCSPCNINEIAFAADSNARVRGSIECTYYSRSFSVVLAHSLPASPLKGGW